MNLKFIAHVLGGEVSNGQLLCPGPGHSKTDRSLSIKSGGAPDGFIVHSFAGDDPIVCRDYVRQRLGLPAWRRNGGGGQSTKFGLYGSGTASTRPSQAREFLTPIRSDNAASAAHIWKESCNPRGTTVENYLQSRGLQLPVEAANEAIRFHQNCPFFDSRTAAMVCLVRDIVTNKPLGIHLQRSTVAAARPPLTARIGPQARWRSH